jgi:hypothetical protein
MHTDASLNILDEETVRIGTELRAFADKTCSSFKTRELSREIKARKCRQLKRGTGSSRSSNRPMIVDSTVNHLEDEGRRLKTFNLDTFKLHSLGDYADIIRQLGTTDSYSTEPVRS